jgi:hypothetical protein
MVVASPALATDWKYQRKYIYNPNAVPPQPAVDVRMCQYPTGAAGNQCPGHLVPVRAGGVVSCGTPNAEMCSTYTPTKRVVYRQPTPQRRVVCPVGEKGCNTK